MAYTRLGLAHSPVWARYGRCKPVANAPETALASQLELIAPIGSCSAKASEYVTVQVAGQGVEAGSRTLLCVPGAAVVWGS